MLHKPPLPSNEFDYTFSEIFDETVNYIYKKTRNRWILNFIPQPQKIFKSKSQGTKMSSIILGLFRMFLNKENWYLCRPKYE